MYTTYVHYGVHTLVIGPQPFRKAIKNAYDKHLGFASRGGGQRDSKEGDLALR
jgi:hypothetical protein